MSKINADEIDIEKSTKNETGVVKQQPQSEPKKEVWQFRYRNYREITSIPDSHAAATKTGQRPNVVIKARNWRLELDLTNPDDKKVSEYMHEHKATNPAVWLVKDRNVGDHIATKAATLKKVMDMSVPQLLSFFTDDELRSCGLPAGCSDKMLLITAIIDNKKLDIK
jgi:hypothetical protein